MPAPSLYITITEAVDLIRKSEEIDVARSTVYGWVKSGRKGQKLRTRMRAGKLYTRITWVQEFLEGI